MLGLCHNEIADTVPLAKMTGLTWLEISNNLVDDIEALSDLENLGWLVLSSNNIEDISPLVNNAGIGVDDLVGLSSNPVDCGDPDIATLLDRGVTLRISCDLVE